jgi:hypothetical protein
MKKKTQKENHKVLIINELFFCVSFFSQKKSKKSKKKPKAKATKQTTWWL